MNRKKHSKAALLALSIAVISSLCIYYFQHRNIMKLVHNKTGFVVVEFKQGKPHFKDRMLEKELSLKGIVIPPAFKEEFDGKSVVRIGDRDFEKAFKKVYCKLTLEESSYHWENLS